MKNKETKNKLWTKTNYQEEKFQNKKDFHWKLEDFKKNDEFEQRGKNENEKRTKQN